MFKSLALLLIAGLLVSTCHDHHHHTHDPPHLKYTQQANLETKKPVIFHPPKHLLRTESSQQLWLETAGAVLLISLAPLVLLFILPDLNKHHRLLKIMLAFAAGGLLGDAFLHLIPHAVDQGRHSESNAVDHHDHHDHHAHHDHHDHHAHHDHGHHMIVGLSILSGIFVFLSLEKFIRLLQLGSGHHHSHEGHPVQSAASGNAEASKGKKGKKSGSSNNNNTASSDTTTNKQDRKAAKASREFRAAGYLNLAADFTHNFTDGLAIGASFLISRQLGMVTTMTVLFHELPHEIGDYAILIQSGCSARKAMLLQLTTAIGAAIGAALSLLAAGVGFGSVAPFEVPALTDDLIKSCVLPFTAGGFIYIAMTSVLPDLLSESVPVAGRSQSGFLSRMAQNFAELFALVFGVGMMALLGSLE